jgi:hypothetical protein
VFAVVERRRTHGCLDNGSTFSRKPREQPTANLDGRHARLNGCNDVLAGLGLEELPKFFNREARVTNYAAHCVFIDRIVARNCENATPVTHDDVLALIDDAESCLL